MTTTTTTEEGWQTYTENHLAGINLIERRHTDLIHSDVVQNMALKNIYIVALRGVDAIMGR